jgi:L-ascorbate metabolism protein UlaG (beta-lactamase superfamily)
MRITFVGHSTVLIELDGLRLLTDPVLRRRVAHLWRAAPAIDRNAVADVGVALVSHMHHDHFDPPSLRGIGREAQLIVPPGAARAAARLGFERLAELGVGETIAIGALTVTATYALHRRGRLAGGHSEAIGYSIAGTQRVYFAGDTDIFPGMRELRAGLDVALLPVGGWGPKLGPGHLDARRAAESLALLEPRVAVPIHWGTFHRIGMRRSLRLALKDPPHAFAREAAALAPAVDVRVLQPGETTVVEPMRSS